MISIVIPVNNLKEYTDECIENLVTYSTVAPEIIIVDNGSTEPYSHPSAITLRNEKNVGFWPSMLQGMQKATNDIVLCMHNDVFIWEQDYDIRIQNAFDNDYQLALVGFFGARGVQTNGARLFCESNMVAKKYGTHGNLHGNVIKGMHPAVVFDSLAMCYRKSHLQTIDARSIPPHHWTDRLVTLRLLVAGYHCATLGIEFDHGGGFTSSTPVMNTFTEDWCKEHNLPMNETNKWDNVLYKYGESIFANEFLTFTHGSGRLWVQFDYSLGFQ